MDDDRRSPFDNLLRDIEEDQFGSLSWYEWSKSQGWEHRASEPAVDLYAEAHRTSSPEAVKQLQPPLKKISISFGYLFSE